MTFQIRCCSFKIKDRHKSNGRFVNKRKVMLEALKSPRKKHIQEVIGEQV